MARPDARIDTEATNRLAVSRLMLTDFRNYSEMRLDVGAESVVLTGPNGAGKTNVLEALSFLVPGRGLRRARLDDVARRAPEGGAATNAWAVAARIETPTGPVEVGTGRDAGAGDERRRVRVDGQTQRGQTALAEVFSAVWLTPQMDRLFLEGASGRRRFLDRLVFGLDPAHAGRVAAYDTALRQRARLLRDGVADAAWLSALEETIAEKGIAVAAARREATERLGAACDVEGPFPGATLAVDGDAERWLDEGPALAAEDRLRTALAAARRADAAAGSTTVGPHRSDFVVRHRASGRPAAECSTGEQKTLLIAIVLASARVQAAERGTVPVLLLDEVAAHLDARNRAALFDAVADLGAQAWYTGTEPGPFAPLAGRARAVTVEAGRVTPGDWAAR